MGTINWERAERALARRLDPGGPEPTISIALAIETYLADLTARKLRPSTITRYERVLKPFAQYCAHQRYLTMESLTLAAFTEYRGGRSREEDGEPLAATTQRFEIETLRSFCGFALEREWLKVNWAKKLKPPRSDEVHTWPFDQGEIDKLLEACDRIENANFESAAAARPRAKALVLLLLYSGLRISDAASLERSRLQPDGRLFLRKQRKTGTPVYCRLPASVVEALTALPEGKYFFWTGKSKLTTITGSLARTVACLARLSKVKAHPHRFRDTFAVRLLEQDVPIRTVQILLGHKTVRTTEEHYAPYLHSQQRLLDTAVARLDFGESGKASSG